MAVLPGKRAAEAQTLELLSRATVANTSHLPPAASADEPMSLVQHLRRNREPQGFCRLQIDDKLDLRIHLHRDLPRVCPFEDLVYQTCPLPAGFIKVWPVAGETALLHEERCIEHAREPLLGCGLQNEAGNVQR